jgi:hypothetical protein
MQFWFPYLGFSSFYVATSREKGGSGPVTIGFNVWHTSKSTKGKTTSNALWVANRWTDANDFGEVEPATRLQRYDFIKEIFEVPWSAIDWKNQ